MSKLEEIEANANLQRGWADTDDTAWLIARVRKLEEGIRSEHSQR